MITRVRIAPLEQWCAQLLARDVGKFHRLVGREVEIEIDSMKRREQFEIPAEDMCEGPFWRVSETSRRETADVLDRSDVAYWVCRHQLEMD